MRPIYKDFAAAWQSGGGWPALRAQYVEPHRELLEHFYRNFVYGGKDGDVEEDYRRYWAERPQRVDALLTRLAEGERTGWLQDGDRRGRPTAGERAGSSAEGDGNGQLAQGEGTGRVAQDDGNDRSPSGAVAEIITRVRTGLDARVDVDVVGLIGLGTTNACQLIHRGVPTVILALDAWGRTFYDTPLPWSDIPLWLSHELAHVLRYAEGESGFSEFIVDGSLDYNRAVAELSLVEFLVDEGLATAVARHFGMATADGSPPGGPWKTTDDARRLRNRLDQASRKEEADRIDAKALGFTPEQLAWCRAHEDALWRELASKLHEPLTTDGYSRYFSFGADDIPPRTGYYIGLRLVERHLAETGAVLSEALRKSASTYV